MFDVQSDTPDGSVVLTDYDLKNFYLKAMDSKEPIHQDGKLFTVCSVEVLLRLELVQSAVVNALGEGDS